MNRNKRIAIAASVIVAALGVAGAAVVNASTDDETETPITGADLQRASDAALAHTGQGRVTGTEVGDEDSFYEVEVTLDDGTEVDVQLDENFQVVDVPEHDNDAGEVDDSD